jgi:hypothetical protein
MSGRCTAALLVVRKWYNCSVAATTSPFAEQLYTLAVVNTFLFGKQGEDATTLLRIVLFP